MAYVLLWSGIIYFAYINSILGNKYNDKQYGIRMLVCLTLWVLSGVVFSYF